MNLLGMLLDAQGSPALNQLTSAFGVSEGEAKDALSALVPALARGMQNNLYRDYFMERIEHMADRMTTKSVYPSVSMAPGQRFVSKGCYIVRLDAKSKDGFTPVSDWLTP